MDKNTTLEANEYPKHRIMNGKPETSSELRALSQDKQKLFNKLNEAQGTGRYPDVVKEVREK